MPPLKPPQYGGQLSSSCVVLRGRRMTGKFRRKKGVRDEMAICDRSSVEEDVRCLIARATGDVIAAPSNHCGESFPCLAAARCWLWHPLFGGRGRGSICKAQANIKHGPCQSSTAGSQPRVPPFGEPRLDGCSHLPEYCVGG